jgi:hypothetical protein
MALQHLAGDLGVAWLVDTDEADDLEASKKEKSAERDERYQLGGAAGAIVRAKGVCWFEFSECDDY